MDQVYGLSSPCERTVTNLGDKAPAQNLFGVCACSGQEDATAVMFSIASIYLYVYTPTGLRELAQAGTRFGRAHVIVACASESEKKRES